MSTALTIAPIVETEPGHVMPRQLKELDFETGGSLVTPAKMDGDTVTLSSSCSSARPTSPKAP
ncbi:hypothetical protein [Arthrobacter woluwensis]|uniref:Uncharacterized protein n=1 Tax=Arthrobacter woluwensis TaxID=156980 RepID=A0A1H4RBQ0_9MICC|nr:hypothetical protein [Arthrobacter woluwensis]SEC29305.1 hypothetical protein SAMN04489745_2516 [Arthrobacter woluwensis]